MSVLEQLQNIENLALKLKEKCVLLEEQHDQMAKENARLKEDLNKKEVELHNLAETNKISKLAEGVANNSDNTALKAEIDRMIKEIDSCLKLVKR